MSDLVELFGNSTVNQTGIDWKKVVKEQWCPYLNRKCIKIRKSQPEISIGTCSVFYGRKRNPIIICPYRQIFTLFHELAHLLLQTGGIDTRLEDYIDLLQADNKQIEVLCNSFAGAFLVPDDDFDQRIRGLIPLSAQAINDETIESLARCYWVSHEVILRKLHDRQLVEPAFYARKISEWSRKNQKKAGTGGSYYANQGVYLSERYLELAFSRYYQQRISLEQLADYLGVKIKNVPDVEALLLRKETTA
jgi:Zn-dependent peptidase ImmA (M78 family)